MITKLSSFDTSQTWRVNLKALELVKQVEWPFYIESSIAYDSTFFDQMKVKMPWAQSMNFGRLLPYFDFCMHFFLIIVNFLLVSCVSFLNIDNANFYVNHVLAQNHRSKGW